LSAIDNCTQLLAYAATRPRLDIQLGKQPLVETHPITSLSHSAVLVIVLSLVSFSAFIFFGFCWRCSGQQDTFETKYHGVGQYDRHGPDNRFLGI